jgi:hypothetical protein
MQKILLSMQDYYRVLINTFLKAKQSSEDQSKAQEIFEKALLNLPNWIYQSNTATGLASGQQFFLMTIERMSDVMFALQYNVRFDYDLADLAAITEYVQECAQDGEKFFQYLISLVSGHPVKFSIQHFEQALTTLENQIYLIVPKKLELIAMHADHIHLALVIFNLKELYRLGLKLLAALRVAVN